MPLQSYCLADQLNATSFWGFASSGHEKLKVNALLNAARFCGFVVGPCNPEPVATHVDLCPIHLSGSGQTSLGVLHLFNSLYTDSVEALCLEKQYCTERLHVSSKQAHMTLAITLGTCAAFLGFCFIAQFISRRRETINTGANPQFRAHEQMTITIQADEESGLLGKAITSYNTLRSARQ